MPCFQDEEILCNPADKAERSRYQSQFYQAVNPNVTSEEPQENAYKYQDDGLSPDRSEEASELQIQGAAQCSDLPGQYSEASCHLAQNQGTLERFDVASGSWTKLPDMPTPRGGVGAAIAAGRLFVAGGESPTRAFDTVEAFDVGAGTWSAAPPLNTGRHGIAVVAVGSTLYALDGGVQPGGSAPSAVAEVLRL